MSNLDRYISVILPNWKALNFKPKHAIVTSACCICVFFALNSNVLVIYGWESNINDTIVFICWPDESELTNWYQIWNRIHALFNMYLPFIFLIIINILLVYRIRNMSIISHSTNQARRRRQRSVNFTIICLTLLYIALNLPATLVSIFYNQLFFTYYGQIIILVGDLLDFSDEKVQFMMRWLVS